MTNRYTIAVETAKAARIELDKIARERYAVAVFNRDPYYFLLSENIIAKFKSLSK